MDDTGLSPLLESAHEFLEESLSNFSDGKLNFAIVNGVTATELVLKARLAKMHPALIFKDIDSKSSQKDQHTVSLGALPRRMANLGMPLSPTAAMLIRDIAQWRHEIVHHMPTFDVGLAEKQLPKLLDFLASFLRSELNTPLESFLSRDLYKDALRLLNDWQIVVAVAQANAAAEGNLLPEGGCPKCGAYAVLCLRADFEVHCHLCGNKLYQYKNCSVCGCEALGYSPAQEGYNVCDACMDSIGDRVAQEQLDLARGK